MLGQLTREQQTNGGLNFAGRESASLVVADQTARLSSDALEDVVDERVHDAHGTAGDADVGVDLLEHPVDVGRIGLRASASAAFTLGSIGVAGSFGLSGGLGGLALSTGCLGRHDCIDRSSNYADGLVAKCTLREVI